MEIREVFLSMQCCLEAETGCSFPKDLESGYWHLGEQKDLDQKPVELEGRNIFLLKEG